MTRLHALLTALAGAGVAAALPKAVLQTEALHAAGTCPLSCEGTEASGYASTALGDGNAADLGAVGQGGGQNAGLDGRNGEEEGRKPSSESADHGRRWSGTVAPASSK